MLILSGKRQIACRRCACKTCKETGSTSATCSKCSGGQFAYGACSGGGQVVVKKGFFSDKFGPYRACNGSGKIKCPTCLGTASVKQPCPTCSGTRRLPQCGTCGGTGNVGCATCAGKGQLISEWFKSLQAMPVERLRFEHEKREREIASVQRENHSTQIEISRLSREAQEMYNWSEQERSRNPDAYKTRPSFTSNSTESNATTRLGVDLSLRRRRPVERSRQVQAHHDR